MNFITIGTVMKVFDEASIGKEFLKYICKGNFEENNYSDITIAKLSQEAYIGHKQKAKKAVRDLLFTRTMLKEIKYFISSAFVKLMANLLNNELTSGKKLRSEGEMNSVLIPGTNQQKVLLFCSVQANEYNGFILIGIDDAMQWNKHGNSRSSKNDFASKAFQRQKYYTPLYHEAVSYFYGKDFLA